MYLPIKKVLKLSLKYFCKICLDQIYFLSSMEGQVCLFYFFFFGQFVERKDDIDQDNGTLAIFIKYQ